MEIKKVAVIGAGPSGITALKNILDVGVKAVCFEAGQKVGGNWIYSEKEGHSSVFETTHIISSKSLSEYMDFPWEKHDPTIPDYPSHQQLAHYFQSYAKEFGLYEFIRFNTKVLNAELQEDESWKLTLSEGEETRTESFSHLIVCNGHHWNPRLPSYPGRFTGKFLHSHQFKNNRPFEGERVLVIGGGNSACDVAVETSRVSARTDLSWRRGYRILPKFFFGKPSDVIGEGAAWLPPKLWGFFTDLLIRLITGNNKAYGLPEPEGVLGTTHPTINDELLYRIRHGKVHPKPDIARFDGKTVHFKDGTSSEYDSIVACTGFKITHPFFSKDFIDYSEGKVPLYLKMMHPDYRSLYFIGLVQPLGCIWPLAELQSKIIAQELIGNWQRPKAIAKKTKKEVENPDHKQIDTPRHTITVNYHQYRKKLLNELSRANAKPKKSRKALPTYFA